MLTKYKFFNIFISYMKTTKKLSKYALKTNEGEIIKTIEATNNKEAINYFSKIKNLERKLLLKIFKVEVIS